MVGRFCLIWDICICKIWKKIWQTVLSLTLNLNKPIVFTGSIIPFSIDGSDALGNLEGALMIAATKDQKKISEVCIYMDGLLLRANRTIKGGLISESFSILQKMCTITKVSYMHRYTTH